MLAGAPALRSHARAAGRAGAGECERSVPCACSTRTPATSVSSNGLLQVHDALYLQRFQTGTLTAAEVRRIGFGDAVRSQVLIDRTIAEVAGVARLCCTPLQP